MHKLVKMSALALLLSTSSAAFAEWKVATSGLLTVYSEEDEASLKETVTNIEVYHRLLKAYSQSKKEGSPLRLTVFLLRDTTALQSFLPGDNQGLLGFYSATERGPYLVSVRRSVRPTGTRKAVADNSKDAAPKILQHEYGHHFMYQYFPGLYPTWYSEGFAEYYGSMDFLPNNVVEVGHAPFYRMDVIRSGWYPMRKLLTAKSYADVGDSLRNLYAQGWLLTHYAASNPERGKQLNQYLVAITQGVKYDEAAKAAFGADIDKLDDEMKAHAKNLTAKRLSLKPMDVGPITIRSLTKGEAAMLQTEMRLNSSFERSVLPLVVRTGRQVIKDNPTDLGAMMTQLEVERLAENFDEAVALADRILALSPNNAKAMAIKGMVQVDKLLAAKSTDDAAFAEARKPIRAAIKIDPNLATAHVGLYKSYSLRGILPPAEAQNGLMKAHQLIPRDRDIRYMLAKDFEDRGFIEDAIFIIEPDAFGALDGDEKKDERQKKKDRKRLQWLADNYTGVVVREDAKDMYERLIAKKAAADGEAKLTS
ncbi:MAG TPA: hypothetical protein PKC48_07995 [Sphingorhabdus sp.]|uniref:hypothetical protein n=1 Tax=Sphingorhabdus sp. TaxID=1902408 RepID=UPI002CBA200F|nr:hypothetical protein [Sphingorhabdus sp.]HMT40587.1 hypothetical protein [Sphingorhabdus sp.]HMU22215.1 hypothetical protein [Sphingorhabdus sp.]